MKETKFIDKNDILDLIKEIFGAIIKTKKIDTVIPENLLGLKYDGSEKHIEELKKFLVILESLIPKEVVKEETTSVVAKRSRGAYFYAKMFAGLSFTGLTGFLLFYLIRKRK